MKIAFIQPSMCSGKPGDCMEPLVFAFLKALTPKSVETVLYDERIETIPFDEPADAVALSVNTFTARRAYQIAKEYRQRGIPVIAGGFHPTLCPDEAMQFVDAVVIGDAEDTWPQVIHDLQNRTLQKKYISRRSSIQNSTADRTIFRGKKYIPVKPVQFGRGCPHHCDFCSINAFYQNSLRSRSTELLLEELQPIRKRHILFTDDNLLLAPSATLQRLLDGLRSMSVRWSGQISLDAAENPELLKSMASAGCKSVTVGFESLNPKNLQLMGKTANRRWKEYGQAIRLFHDHGIMVYGTFIFGYDFDTVDCFDRTLEFALANHLYLANFNPLTPFPGTALYDRLLKQGRLIHSHWWLNENFRYGQASFRPVNMSAEELEQGCYRLRTEFNKHRNIASRLIRNQTNRRSAYHAAIYLASNLTSRREIHRKQNAQLGATELIEA